MRNFEYKKYIEIIEKSNNEILKRYIKDEIAFLNHNLEKEDCIFDLGAGYGRVLDVVSNIASEVYAIEINQAMYSELNKRAAGLINVIPLHEDLNNLEAIYEDNRPKSRKCGFLLLQNTLGVIENGSWEDAIKNVYNVSKFFDESYIILSVFNGKALPNYGVSIYSEIERIVGKINIRDSDFDHAIIRTDTGYEAKWWFESDLHNIIKLVNGTVINKTITKEYSIFKIQMQHGC